MIPVGDKEALLGAMRQLTESPELSEKISANAGKIRQECAVEKIADQMLTAAGMR